LRSRLPPYLRVFTGAAIYINIAEQPARLQLDNRSFLTEWKPAYNAIAQAQYRAAKASGNADVVAHAENTFWSILQEILFRQDPRLAEAWEVCERYRVVGPHDQPDVRLTFEPQYARDFENIDRRYGVATSAIRRDLEGSG
jgi:hypothetical protein